MRRNQIMRLAAVEIYNEISSYWAWPLAIPDIDSVIDRSMRRVARLVSKDYRAPVKVKCCGFTIFRCCCLNRVDSKGNRFNQIVNALEERETSLMQTRAVGDYMETGERAQQPRSQQQQQQRRRGMENEAYEADKRLGYAEDGRYDDGYDGQSYYDDEYSRGGGGSYYSDDYNGDSYYTEESTYASRGGRGRGGRSRRGY